MKKQTVCIVVGALMACADGVPVDLILTGGVIWVGTESDGTTGRGPTAVGIGGGRIVAVGDDATIEGMAGAGTRRVDLMGRRVVPGFIDNHTHFVDGGFTLSSVQLRDADSPQEFARRIGAFATEHPNEWVMGGSWDHESWGGELPRRDWIDSLTGDTPVFVSRLDLHMGLANSRALELAGIDANTPAPPGGEIVRYEDGRPTGILKDVAQDRIFAVLPERTDEMMDRALQVAAGHALERGVTFITDMGSFANLRTYRRAYQGGELPLRVYAVTPIAQLDELAELVAAEGRGDSFLFWGGTKGFVDGSLGSTTAWFYDDYTDEPGETGFTVTDTTVLREQILASDRSGNQVIIHAIGDRANDWLLDTFESAVAQNGSRDRRFRIEHTQHVRPEAIQRLAHDRVIASMQPYHAIDDGRWAENRIGPERIQTTYAFRSILDAGGYLTFGSDWTVAPIDPLLGIYAAVTRRTLDGANPNGWVPQQRISVAEAVTAYTRTNAYASFLDGDVGTIEDGKLADLVVLSQDIFTIDPRDIEHTRVDMTIVNGTIRFER